MLKRLARLCYRRRWRVVMQVSFESVEAVRARIARAQQLAALRFRDAFAAGPLPPVAHLRIQAAALIEAAKGGRLNGEIAYDVTVDLVTPYVERGKPIHPYFEVARTPEAIFEYWLILAEIEASNSWRMTRASSHSSWRR